MHGLRVQSKHTPAAGETDAGVGGRTNVVAVVVVVVAVVVVTPISVSTWF